MESVQIEDTLEDFYDRFILSIQKFIFVLTSTVK